MNNSRSYGVNILLVDDQPSNLLALEAMLADLGQNLVRACSGVEALRRLLEQDFALILLDVRMPEMDGYETARIIRERDRSQDVPIIFITAHLRTQENIFQGYALGAVDYLFKPIVPEVLRSKVQFFVELYQKTQALREQASELARLSRQNELILNSAADGVFGIGLEGNVTFVNPAAARMLGRSMDKLHGVNVHDLIHPGRDGQSLCTGHRCPVKSALGCDVTYDLQENIFWRADGTSFPVEFSVTPIRSGEGELFGCVLTFRDITERRAAALARENEQRYREAEAASRAKDDFLATLSHELRTPMTAILGWIDMLSLDHTNQVELRGEALESIHSAARHQAQLIDDMLDVSRIILGKFHLALVPVRVAEILKVAVETVRPNAVKKKVALQIRIDSPDVRVLGDPVRLKQVFWNLLSNAIKFTHPGGQVNITASSHQGEAVVVVSDTGIGIEPGLLPTIFDRLRQGEYGKKQGGLGLGLAIVRHIVEAHRGRVEASSAAAGTGSTFTVTLPLVEKRSPDSPTSDLLESSVIV